MSDLTRLDAADPVVLVDDTGTNSAPISATTPTGSETGLYVRIVSTPGASATNQIQVRSSAGTSTDVGYRGVDLKVPIQDINGIYAPFIRQRIGNPFPIFDAKFAFDKAPLFFAEQLTGGGTSTFDSNASLVTMAVTTASGDKVVRQGKIYIPVQSGQGELVQIGAVMGSIKANTRQRIGLFDADDGLFFEQDGTNLRIVTRTSNSGSAVDTAVNQSSWNLDKLDGTGASGLTVDTSKANYFIIDFQNDIGRVRFGFILSGNVIYCHAVDPSLTTSNGLPNAPVRLELENTGVSASSTNLLHIASSVFHDGYGEQPNGVVTSTFNTTGSGVLSSGTSQALISVRLRSGYTKGMLIPIKGTIVATSNAALSVEIYLGATITGGSWVSLGTASERNITMTAFSGGTLIASELTASQNPGSATIAIGGLYASSDLAGNVDTITVVVTALSGNVANSWASLFWKEVY